MGPRSIRRRAPARRHRRSRRDADQKGASGSKAAREPPLATVRVAGDHRGSSSSRRQHSRRGSLAPWRSSSHLSLWLSPNCGRILDSSSRSSSSPSPSSWEATPWSTPSGRTDSTPASSRCSANCRPGQWSSPTTRGWLGRHTATCPPDLTDPSYARIAAGYLTADDMVAALRRPEVCAYMDWSGRFRPFAQAVGTAVAGWTMELTDGRGGRLLVRPGCASDRYC